MARPNRIHSVAAWPNIASWDVVRRTDADEAAYRTALEYADAAARLEPENSYILNTLGIAQYRVGQYGESLKALTRSDEIYSKQPTGPEPGDIAFLAMAYHRLAHADQARQLLDRLRQLLEQDRWKNDTDSLSFLREAEALIEGDGAKPKE